MKDGYGHGCGVTLRNNGNDGSASVDERPDGIITVIVNGNLLAISRLTIMINGREVVVPDDIRS